MQKKFEQRLYEVSLEIHRAGTANDCAAAEDKRQALLDEADAAGVDLYPVLIDIDEQARLDA